MEILLSSSTCTVCDCENIPLSRLLDVILGNSQHSRKYLTDVQVAEASWLTETMNYTHFKCRLPPGMSEISQDGCSGGV